MFLQKENSKNVLLTKRDVKNILGNYGIKNISINRLDVYQRCFIHRSYLNLAVEGNIYETSNERFELLGDCILGCVVGTYLFTRFEDQDEGFLTQLKIKIIRSKTLGALSKKMGLGKYVVISQHVENENGRSNVRILEDLFESFIGALFLDNGGCIPLCENWLESISEMNRLNRELCILESDMIESDMKAAIKMRDYIMLSKRYRQLSAQVSLNKSTGFLICQRFIISVLETELDIVGLIAINDNYKDQLQHYFQRNYKGTFPEWKIEDITGPTNKRIHTVSISDDRGMCIGVGKAKKKIDAEQEASKQALIFLGVITDESTEELIL